MSAPHFLVDREILTGSAYRLAPETSHHAIRVLRMRVGDEITLTSGTEHGWFIVGRIIDADPTGVLVEEVTTIRHPKREPRITVAFALTKGAKPEFTVEKLTELGVDRIIPWNSARSIVDWDERKRAQHGDRMRATAISALQQSRRAHLPEVLDPVPSLATLRTLLEGDTVITFDRDATDELPADFERPTTLVIGPEGGLTDEELRAFAGPVVRILDDGVLRAETAAIAAAALVLDRRNRGWLQHRRDKLG